MKPLFACAAFVLVATAFDARAQGTLPPGSAAAPAAGQPGEIAPSRDVRLGTLLGQELIDANGRALGRIDDAALDVNNDRVVALRVTADGQRRDVALNALRPRDRGLEALPRASAPRDATAPQPAREVDARRLLGTAVRDADGAELGRIEDIVVSVDDMAIRYVVVHLPTPGADDGRLIPLPLRSFTLQEDGELRASLPRARLEGAPAFTRAGWPRLGDPVFQSRLRAWFATVPMRDATNVKSNQG